MRQIAVNRPAEGLEHFLQQGGGSHAINVVISENYERLIAFARAEEAGDGGFHVWEKERVGELFEPGLEEGADRGRFVQAAVQEALSQQGAEAQISREFSRKERLRGRE